MRTQCCVPFCNRTTAGKYEWICSRHWMAVPRSVKEPLFKARRTYRRKFGENPFWHYKGGSPQRLEAVALTDQWNAAWDECKRVAIEQGLPHWDSVGDARRRPNH